MTLIGLLVAIIILGLIYYLLSLVVDMLPPPFAKVGKIVLILIAVIFLLSLATGIVQMPYFRVR